MYINKNHHKKGKERTVKYRNKHIILIVYEKLTQAKPFIIFAVLRRSV